MILLGRRPDEITDGDLEGLVANGITENDRLEYKRDMYGRDDESRRELLRDITALANHRGGHLLIGVDEDSEGAASEIVGVPAGDHAGWIRSLCLSGVEERILGLGIFDVPLASDNLVILVDIPESPNAPHMVTLKGLNQFWRRHGREKQKMTVDEIRDGFTRVLDARGRIEQFRQRRQARILPRFGDRCFMVLSTMPAYYRDDEVLDTRDAALRSLILNPPPLQGGFGRNVSCGRPYPTLEGLRADNTSPYWGRPQEISDFLEVFRNGYVEFGKLLEEGRELGLHFAGKAHAEYIAGYCMFIRQLYDTYLPGAPILVHFTLYNCQGMWLATQRSTQGQAVRWPEQHLDLGEFLVEDIVRDQQLLPKRLCDRLWNAFHHDETSAFDASGNLKASP